MNKRQRRKRAKRANARFAERLRDSGAVRSLGEVCASFIRGKLLQPSVVGWLLPPYDQRLVRPAGRWKDDRGIVHAVNALFTLGKANEVDVDIDLGRETACTATFWNPDDARLYPEPSDKDVDCMACIARRSCT